MTRPRLFGWAGEEARSLGVAGEWGRAGVEGSQGFPGNRTVALDIVFRPPAPSPEHSRCQRPVELTTTGQGQNNCPMPRNS